MKTTVEIPAALYTRAKHMAAARGVSFRRILLEALEEKVNERPGKPWMEIHGILAAEAEAVYGVDRTIETDLSTVDPAEWE